MFGSSVTYYVIRCLVLFLAGVGIYTFYDSMIFYYQAEQATGLVTQVETEIRGKGRRAKSSYYPVIEFVSPTGERRSFKSKFGTSAKRYRVGDQVGVLFTGKIAIINSFVNLWIPTIYSIAVAIILLVCFREKNCRKI